MDRNETTAARKTLANWQDGRCATPFGTSNSRSAEDRAEPYLLQAKSMLRMLAAASEDTGELLRRGDSSTFDELGGGTLGNALDGISTLISLASFMLEDDGGTSVSDASRLDAQRER